MMDKSAVSYKTPIILDEFGDSKKLGWRMSFGYVDGQLYFSKRHHSVIFKYLFENGEDWDSLINKPQAWGWLWRQEEDNEFYGVEEGNLMLQFYSDVARHDPEVIEEVKKVMDDVFLEELVMYKGDKPYAPDAYGEGYAYHNDKPYDYDDDSIYSKIKESYYGDDDYDRDEEDEDEAVVEPDHSSRISYQSGLYWKFIYDIEDDELVRVWATAGYYGNPWHTRVIYDTYGSRTLTALYVPGYMDYNANPAKDSDIEVYSPDYAGASMDNPDIPEDWEERAIRAVQQWAGVSKSSSLRKTALQVEDPKNTKASFEKDGDFNACFGFVDDVLYIGTRHHALIIRELIESGKYNFETLMNAKQTWGWLIRLNYWYPGYEPGVFYVSWSTDEARLDWGLKGKAMAVISQYYGQKVVQKNKGFSQSNEEYGLRAERNYGIERTKRRETKTAANVVDYENVVDYFKDYDSQYLEACFGFIDDTLYLGETHHALIIRNLINNKVYDFETLMNAKQTWGWLYYDGESRWGTNGRIQVRWSTDEARLDWGLKTKAMTAIRQAFGKPVIQDDKGFFQSNEGYGERAQEQYGIERTKRRETGFKAKRDFLAQASPAELEPTPLPLNEWTYNPDYVWKFIYQSDIIKVWPVTYWLAPPNHTEVIANDPEFDYNGDYVIGYINANQDAPDGITVFPMGSSPDVEKARKILIEWKGSSKISSPTIQPGAIVLIDAPKWDPEVRKEHPIYWYQPDDILFMGTAGTHHSDIFPQILEYLGQEGPEVPWGPDATKFFNKFVGADWIPSEMAFIYLLCYGNTECETVPDRLKERIQELDPDIRIYYGNDKSTDQPFIPPKNSSEIEVDWADIKFVSMPHRLLIGENTYHAYLLMAQYDDVRFPHGTVAIGRAFMNDDEIVNIQFDYIRAPESRDHALRQIAKWAESRGYGVTLDIVKEESYLDQTGTGIKFVWHPNYGLGTVESPIIADPLHVMDLVNSDPKWKGHADAFNALEDRPSAQNIGIDQRWIAGCIGENRCEFKPWRILGSNTPMTYLVAELIAALKEAGLVNEDTEFVDANSSMELWARMGAKESSEYEIEDESGHVKYPRTYHLPWSPGRSEDDVGLEVVPFDGQEIVITEKLDGENTTMYSDYIHSRSMDSGYHPTRTMVKKLHGEIGYQIPEGWRIVGENMQGLHSIAYEMPYVFYVFAIFDEHNMCLSWDETVEVANMLNLPTVPVIYRGPWDEKMVQNLKVEPSFSEESEGYVVRVTDSFPFADFSNNVAKFVRENHVPADYEPWYAKEPEYNKILEKSLQI